MSYRNTEIVGKTTNSLFYFIRLFLLVISQGIIFYYLFKNNYKLLLIPYITLVIYDLTVTKNKL